MEGENTEHAEGGEPSASCAGVSAPIRSLCAPGMDSGRRGKTCHLLSTGAAMTAPPEHALPGLRQRVRGAMEWCVRGPGPGEGFIRVLLQ